MTFGDNRTGLQLRSLVRDGELRLSLERVPIPAPGDDEVLVRVEATPLNPSDLGTLIGPADLTTANVSGDGEDAVVTAKIAPQFARMTASREGQSLPVGNEGAGVVVEAGAGAKQLVGKTVAILGGAMYAQYRAVKAADALVLHDDATPKDGASCFVNPLTALGMVGTMRLEGHTGLVHTAAASNLGQMLVKICLADGVPLVNIVRKADQAALLKGLGAAHVVDSSHASFMDDLIAALDATGATLAFDAIGGGPLAGQILTAMEVVAARKSGGALTRYGSTTHKQVYIYGGLDTGPTTLNRAFGMAWGMGGWLLTYFIQKVGPAEAGKLRQRVANELKTTFASHYTAELSLADVLDPGTLAAINKKATGEKYLIVPPKGV